MLIKIDEVSEGFKNIEVKKYLSFGLKHTIIKTILENSTTEESNLFRLDFSLLEMIKQYSLVNNYSNLDLSEEQVLDSYDRLKELGIIQFVLNNIPSDELAFFDKVIDQEVNQIQKLNNSIEGIVAKGLNQLITKLPNEKLMAKMIKDLPKQINKISPDSLKYLTQAIGWNKGE